VVNFFVVNTSRSLYPIAFSRLLDPCCLVLDARALSDVVTMNVLVTGAAGFIGSHLCERLVADGHRVVGLDAFTESYSASIKRLNLKALSGHAGFRLIEGNILDRSRLDSILGADSIDLIIHLAAIPGVAPSLEHPVDYYEVNVLGTATLMESARRHGLEHIILASSSSVYGSTSRIPFVAEDPILDPVSPYGASKLAMEIVARSYHGLGIRHVSLLRLFTVYGPRQRPEMAIHHFTRTLLAGRTLTLYDRGESERDYTYVGDIVDGICRVMDRPQGLMTLNLGRGHPVGLKALVAALASRLGVEAHLQLEPPREGDVHRTWADVSHAQRCVGFEPSTRIEDGIGQFVEWYLENRKQLEAVSN